MYIVAILELLPDPSPRSSSTVTGVPQNASAEFSCGYLNIKEIS